MHNLWVSRKNAMATWRADFRLKKVGEEALLEWVRQVIEAGERELIYVVERFQHLGYDRSLERSVYPAVRRHYEQTRRLDCFGLDGWRCDLDKLTATVCAYGADGSVAEHDTSDLAEILTGECPADKIDDLRHRMPLEIHGTTLDFRAIPTWLKSMDGLHTSCAFSSYSDIWFPEVQGHLVRERAYDLPALDNRELALRHTPRLNRFLAVARAATLQAGGQWCVDDQASDGFCLGWMQEEGVDLAG